MVHIEPLRIAGFGACMIDGYPHKSGGLFQVACTFIQETLSRPVQSTLVSLGGFPAHRAQKHLKPRLFHFNPQYIVFQLGATDAQCAIRASSRSLSRGLKPNATSRSGKASKYAQLRQASLASYVRWEIAALIGIFRNIEPIAPLPLYIEAIETMVADCRYASITPVILTPFPYGSRYTARRAIPYVEALYNLHSRMPDIVLVDCIGPLAKFPKTSILQHDGFHLSGLGHGLVGQETGKAIVTHVLANSQSQSLPSEIGAASSVPAAYTVGPKV